MAAQCPVAGPQDRAGRLGREVIAKRPGHVQRQWLHGFLAVLGTRRFDACRRHVSVEIETFWRHAAQFRNSKARRACGHVKEPPVAAGQSKKLLGAVASGFQKSAKFIGREIAAGVANVGFPVGQLQ